MRKGFILLLVSVVLTAILTGCGGSGESAAAQTTTIELKKNGGVTHTIVESFSEEYYDLEALKNTMQEACDAFNTGAGGEAVKVESVTENDGGVTVVMQYEDTSAYAGFNKQALFSGTVKDAFNAGYDLDVSLSAAGEKGAVIGRQDLLNMGEKNIVIVREAVNVKVWGKKILYYSDDVAPAADTKTVTVTDGTVLTYIIFE